MSGKPNPCIERARWWLLLGSLCCGMVCTQAWGRSLGDLADDPLFARPPVLDTGAVLPSDAQPIPCPARGDLAAPLALAEAVDLGLCNNPQVKAAWAAIKIQAGAVGEARAAYLPTLTGSLSTMHTRNEFPDRPEANTSSDGHTVYLGLSWRLFDFGARSANREAANLMLAAAISGHDAALQKVLATVVGAYFDALTQQAAMQGPAPRRPGWRGIPSRRPSGANTVAPPDKTTRCRPAPRSPRRNWPSSAPRRISARRCRHSATPWDCLRARRSSWPN